MKLFVCLLDSSQLYLNYFIYFLYIKAEKYFEEKIPDSDPDSYFGLLLKLHHSELFVHKFEYERSLSILSPIIRRPRNMYTDLGYTSEKSSTTIRLLSDKTKWEKGSIGFSSAMQGIHANLSARDVLQRFEAHIDGIVATVESMYPLIQLRVDPNSLQVFMEIYHQCYSYINIQILCTYYMHWQQALVLLKRASEKHPTNVSVFNCMGEVLGQSGDATGGLEAFRKAFEICPRHPMALLNAARVYQQMGQASSCEMHLREALLRDNTLVLAYVDCAQLCLQPQKVQASTLSEDLDDDVNKLVGFKKADAYLKTALHLCRHISEVADVFATETIAILHRDTISL